MKLEQIVTGLLELLRENNYNESTIAVYEREWNHLKDFLVESYGDTEFSIEKGVCYLEHKYGFVTKYENGTISQQRVQFLRMIHLLEDYQLHGVLTKRYYASKNPIVLNEEYQNILAGYVEFLNTTELSKCTKEHYSSQCTVFLDYLQQIKLSGISTLSIAECNNYIKTMSGYSYKTIEQNICGLRHFLRYLYKSEITAEEIADKISMPNISKSAKIPSAWTVDELKLFLSVIDRSSPIGKRDYAAILLACILGIRSIDIKHLKFENFNWADHTLSFVQHKTHKPITLPLPNEVGWAVIDYIKNGRPSYYDTDIVFIKHMPPFDPIADNVHLSDRITYYMQKAHISTRKNKHSGFHSLRHSAASLMLESGTELPVITEILGHSDTDVTAIYLKTDVERLKECVLDLSFDDVEFRVQ